MCDPAKVLEEFTYKPGWNFYFNPATENTPATVLVHMSVDNSEPPHERVDTGMPRVLRDYEDMSVEEFLDWMRQTIGICEAHERDEWIRYQGDKVFDQHNLPLQMTRGTHS